MTLYLQKGTIMFVRTFLKYVATFAASSVVSFYVGILYCGGLDALKEIHSDHLRAVRDIFARN